MTRPKYPTVQIGGVELEGHEARLLRLAVSASLKFAKARVATLARIEALMRPIEGELDTRAIEGVDELDVAPAEIKSGDEPQ